MVYLSLLLISTNLIIIYLLINLTKLYTKQNNIYTSYSTEELSKRRLKITFTTKMSENWPLIISQVRLLIAQNTEGFPLSLSVDATVETLFNLTNSYVDINVIMESFFYDRNSLEVTQVGCLHKPLGTTFSHPLLTQRVI